MARPCGLSEAVQSTPYGTLPSSECCKKLHVDHRTRRCQLVRQWGCSPSSLTPSGPYKILPSKRVAMRYRSVSLALLCLLAVGSALVCAAKSSASEETTSIRMWDNCDPHSFNEAVSPGTCIPGAHGTGVVPTLHPRSHARQNRRSGALPSLTIAVASFTPSLELSNLAKGWWRS